MLCLPGAQAADDGLKSRLDEVQRDLDRNRDRQAALDEAARRAEAELRGFRLRGIEIAREIHRRSAAISEMEDRLAGLEREEAKKDAHLKRRRVELASTLAALQRIARMPASTLVALPRPPDQTIRSAILLRAAVPGLQQEAARLAGELTALDAVRRKIAAERRELDHALEGMQSERTKLAALTADKTKLLEKTRSAEREAARRAARLSARAGNLRELLERLAQEQAKAHAQARERAQKQAGQRAKAPALRAPDFEPPPEKEVAALPAARENPPGRAAI